VVAALVTTATWTWTPDVLAETTSEMSSTRGISAEDLVYLGWFAGDWDCTAALVRAKVGSDGDAALARCLPGALEALRDAAEVAGKETGLKRARCRWSKTSPAANGISEGFAVEETGGVCAGIVAAAQAVAGTKAEVTTLKGGDTWEVRAQAEGSPLWRLRAVGSAGLPDMDGEGTLRVSELFEVTAAGASAEASKTGPITALVRVVTVYRRVDIKDRKVSGIEGVQTATVLAAPPSPGGNLGDQGLAVYTSFLALAPHALASGGVPK